MEQNIARRLDRIERVVEEIRSTMVDVDVILTEEERIMLNKSVENERLGKLVSLEELKNARNKIR